ncbi:GalNAc-alpha-(1-_4)-GalNAc-alpha-(1-_3)-diNAcBac-PP-undecaprenol alpha-1,4-N-acetyl-D-galactosaminyltransferase [Komagataeibacter saccharivorans]|uniref:GalNAc-alpha-(1->4)-GalNAc-alpha-(1->3)-diNAcBac-PP-undecaprenol alpha-1,4-N-acetyl-D-galactosaminyltransferase n=1 Tax=Komagataeibacter saccharivorans TaxID=265959 RepID=A0A347W9Y9_9PROT|nr:glycosyltransferase family 4 protein [Komagataeibacter saccharivorans]AXY21682.1 GalNAc-alpha-(1->4)-GalNAc-alpha-(1->3)-diNAcBac-PP-undecaprenol alpha-1,4-N-acetyl-D-galactosaminyltransferase [Komagataeibacter saccharivorans]
MKNYAFIIERFNERGGTERVTAAVMNGLARRGYSIKMAEIFKTFKTPFPLDSHIKQVTLLPEKCHTIFPGGVKNNIKEFLRISWKIFDFLKKEKIDVIIFSSTQHALYGAIPAKICGVPIISWEHFNSRVITDFWPLQTGRRVSARWADHIITLTKQDKFYWESDFHLKAKVTVVPNIVSEFSESEYENREKVVISAGRLVHQKGFDLLLRSWKIVSSNESTKDWKLVIHGNGQLEQDLKNLIHDEDIKNVEIKHEVQDIEQEYKKSSIFVCSSRFEGFSIVVAEAGSAKLPTVSFDCSSGPSEIIEDGKTGILVKPGDIHSMADAILDLINNPEKRKSMAELARERVELFYEETIIDKWEALLNDV